MYDKSEPGYIALSDTTLKDASINETVAPYKKQLEQSMNEVLNISEHEMLVGKNESLLGNFVADLVLETSKRKYPQEKIDLCLLNTGGLRTSLPKGEITRGKVFELMPFENEIVILTLSKSQVEQLITYVVEKEGCPMAGIRIRVQGKESEATINGKAMEERNYTVVTSDYLATGGDNMLFFFNPVKSVETGIKLRDAIIEFITLEKQAGRTLRTEIDGRFSKN